MPMNAGVKSWCASVCWGQVMMCQLMVGSSHDVPMNAGVKS